MVIFQKFKNMYVFIIFFDIFRGKTLAKITFLKNDREFSNLIFQDTE